MANKSPTMLDVFERNRYNLDEISKNFKLRYPGRSVIIQGNKEVIDALRKNESTV